MDMDEVDRAVNEFRNADVIVPVYCMPVGGCEMEYMENRSKVAEIAMKKGYRYSPRLHIDLFGNQWGT
jgi:7-carboxy-7-deazaguanine synthase